MKRAKNSTMHGTYIEPGLMRENASPYAQVVSNETLNAFGVRAVLCDDGIAFDPVDGDLAVSESAMDVLRDLRMAEDWPHHVFDETLDTLIGGIQRHRLTRLFSANRDG